MPPINSDPRRKIRWWPLAAILALAVCALLFIWYSSAGHRQDRVMQTALVLVVCFVLILLWVSFLSRLAVKIRLIVLGAVVLCLLCAAVLFRVRGFSGDLAPIVEWRWSRGISPQQLHTTSGGKHEASEGAAHDYPQFLGPNRNATLNGIRIASNWSERPPRLLWRQSIGAGWSAFAVVGDSAITQEQQGEQELVVCYDLKTGQVRWRHAENTKYESTLAGIGPRATPTIVQGRVYTLGATGRLNCLDFDTGKQIWSKDIVADNHAERAPWGVSGSPLILGELVVVSAGGPDNRSLVAYHKDTGERVWSGGSAPTGYSSPQITTLAGRRQILIFNRRQVAGHDPDTGQMLWQHPWPITECVAQPLPLPGGRLFVSSGYGIGCKLFQVECDEKDGCRVSTIWETPRLKAKFTNVVHRDGYIYGLDDGVLVCLHPATGQRQWKRGRYGHGQLILVGDLLLVQAESGEVVLVEADAVRHRELARFPALDGKTWNNPALAGLYLLVRNDREAACYELPLAP